MFVFVCVCFACELVCCFFAVGVVKIWCSWFVCVGVQSCACVSVFKAVRVTAKTETDKDTEKRRRKRKRKEEKETREEKSLDSVDRVVHGRS